MLIKPFSKINDKESSPEILNASSGTLTQMKNTIYLIKSNEYDDRVFPGKEIYDVVLVTEMIKKLKDVHDFADFNSLYQYITTGNAPQDHEYANYFCKITHIFNGVYTDGNSSDSIIDKFKNMNLYPNISFSIGERENKVIPQSKVLFAKYGTKLLSSVYYTHKAMNKLADMNIMGREELLNKKEILSNIVSRANLIGSYFDITDPVYPNVIPYKENTYSKVSDIKSVYSGKELISNLLNLEIKNIDTSEIRQYEKDREVRNINLRKELMNLDTDGSSDIYMDSLQLRLAARNIAIDFVKISICSMMESIEIIYDTKYDAESGIKNIGFPFNKVSKQFLVSKMFLIVNDFYDICDKYLNSKSSIIPYSNHYRVSLYDNSYEIVVKITMFSDNDSILKTKSQKLYVSNFTKSETFRLNKSEAIHDYLIEGIHNSNSNITMKNTNMLLLTSDK